MKRILLIIVAVIIGSCLSVSAQDIITKKDGSDIQAKILEVTTSEVKYKKYSNLDGPVFTMPKSEILIVRYENGENEVFNDNQKTVALNTDNNVAPGMRYRDYKDFYNTRNYVRQPGDPYTPFWIGFGDFFIPGLGNAITGEWGRAAGFFLSNLGLGLLSYTQRTPVIQNGYTYYEYSGLYWAITAARIGLNVWSICDAVHVAKVKNMYNQDLRAQRASFDFDIEPFFTFSPFTSSGMQPVAGMSLKLSF